MIEESYVSFDTAKLLKDAGFHIPCIKVYNKGSRKLASWSYSADSNQHKYYYSAPTQALAARWLREVHGIHVSSDIFMDSANDADGKTVDEWTFWSYYLFDSSGRIVENSDDRYDSYEEALEAGIKRGLELIKK